MKQVPKWKKNIYLFIVIIVFIRLLYINAGGEINKTYSVSGISDISEATEIPCQNVVQKFSTTQKRLHSIDLIFNGIADDKNGTIILQIVSENELIYQTNISLRNITNLEWKNIYINAELTSKEYSVCLNASEDCTQTPRVLVIPGSNAAEETISSYACENRIDGEIAIQYGYLQYPGWIDRCSVSSLWILFLLIAACFLYYFDQIVRFFKYCYGTICEKISPEAFALVSEIFFCMIIVNCSGINFQPPTKIIFYFISICAAVKLYDKKQTTDILCDTPVKKILLYALYIYAAFSLVGQRIFVSPLDLKIKLSGIFVFLMTILWFIPVIQTVFYLSEKTHSVIFTEKHSLNNLVFTVIISFILLLPSIYNLFANNPGITSPDSYKVMITMVQHLHGANDWHPFFYAAVMKIILSIWNTTYAVIFVQYFFWIYVMLELFFYLRKKNLKDSVLISLAIFTGFNAANILHLNTIWKDIPYTLSLLWVMILLSKLTIDSELYKKKWYIYFELIIALTGIFFYRKNGIVTFIIIALTMAVILYKNKKYGLL